MAYTAVGEVTWSDDTISVPTKQKRLALSVLKRAFKVANLGLEAVGIEHPRSLDVELFDSRNSSHYGAYIIGSNNLEIGLPVRAQSKKLNSYTNFAGSVILHEIVHSVHEKIHPRDDHNIWMVTREVPALLAEILAAEDDDVPIIPGTSVPTIAMFKEDVDFVEALEDAHNLVKSKYLTEESGNLLEQQFRIKKDLAVYSYTDFVTDIALHIGMKLYDKGCSVTDIINMDDETILLS